MNVDKIQAKINKGYSKVAQFLGTDTDWYRPVDYQNAATPLAHQGTITIRFDPRPDFGATAASQYGKASWYAAYDRTDTLVGDYLVTQTGIDGTSNSDTFFIASQESLIPTMVVRCNDVVSFTRPTAPATGTNYYGGMTVPGAPYLVNWPCARTEGPKGQGSVADLPTDTKAPWYKVLLPYFGIAIDPFDVMTDSNNLRYTVSSVELTPLGWRLTVGFAGA